LALLTSTAPLHHDREHAEAVILLPSPMLYGEHKHIVELAANSRLPAMYAAREFVEDGGLMSYGASLPDLFRRAATYVDKILKGANPADLPVEQPTKLELVFNLKTAKQLGSSSLANSCRWPTRSSSDRRDATARFSK